MMCGNPIIMGMNLFPCGQCMPCRLNRRRIWAHRIMIEASQHEYNAFVTLTYSDEFLPFRGSLDAGHARDWLKRIRRAVEPSRIRFYLVGEYGDQMGRPHYHAALFGYQNCAYGETRNTERTGVHRECCKSCDVVRDTWGMGRISVGYLDISTAQYIAGYVTKKMTRHDDVRLEGRYPEFARMSLRPGIGFSGMSDVADVLLRYGERWVDVPATLAHGTKEMPLGRYLRGTLRSMCGMEKGTPQASLDAMNARMWELSAAAPVNADETDPYNKYGPTKKKVLEATKTQRLSLERRTEIFKQKRRM